jgi:hypothetical protein
MEFLKVKQPSFEFQQAASKQQRTTKNKERPTNFKYFWLEFRLNSDVSQPG